MEVDGERHAPVALTPRSLVIHHIGGWVGPRASLDRNGKKKINYPHQDSNPDRTARYTDYDIPDPSI